MRPHLVETGSNLVYAALHQFGGEEVGIPVEAREHLGISLENERELDAVLDDWAGQMLERLLS